MAVKPNINSLAGDVRRAIQDIARHDLAGRDGILIGTKKIFGYVCAVNIDGDLAGTVDVQEFGYEPDGYTPKGSGHHRGVLLSAIQDATDGFFIEPMLFSEVVIVQSPQDGKEYVIMYSHAKRISLQARSVESGQGTVELGVTEVEDFTSGEEGLDKDCGELEPTGNRTKTVYTAQSITDTVASADSDGGYSEERTAAHKVIKVGNTTVTIDGSAVTVETQGDVTITADNATITGGNLTVKGTANTDMQGPFNAIKVCPFVGASHGGSQVSGT